jgi:hypothetical protein
MTSGSGAATGGHNKRLPNGLANQHTAVVRCLPSNCRQSASVTTRLGHSVPNCTVWIDKCFTDAAQCGWPGTDLNRGGKMVVLHQTRNRVGMP